MANAKVRLRGIYGKPLKITLDRPTLMKAARIILKAVKAEIRKDMMKARGIQGGSYPAAYKERRPVPLPDSRRFVDSFSYQIQGNSTIEIVSTWPTAEAHTTPGHDKRRPMTWLVQPKVKYVPIITGTGQVIVRTAPLTTATAWIHPGFVKYNFIERGARKGRQKVLDTLGQQILDLAAKQDVFQ